MLQDKGKKLLTRTVKILPPVLVHELYQFLCRNFALVLAISSQSKVRKTPQFQYWHAITAKKKKKK
jgi:hypothetical protein